MPDPAPVSASGSVPAPDSLSVVIPVFNEEKTVVQLLERVLAQPAVAEVVVVDDGSTDSTAELLANFAHNPRVKLLRHAANSGKGAALKTGIAAASGAMVIFQDADLEYSPEEYPRLIQPILEGHADVVLGSRFIGSDAHRVLYFWHSMGNTLLTLLSNMATNLNLTDMECCYKAFRTDVLRQLEITERGFGIEPEIVAKVAALGVRIYEVGVSYHGRTYAEGKKITWRDGLRAFYVIGRWGFRKPHLSR